MCQSSQDTNLNMCTKIPKFKLRLNKRYGQIKENNSCWCMIISFEASFVNKPFLIWRKFFGFPILVPTKWVNFLAGVESYPSLITNLLLKYFSSFVAVKLAKKSEGNHLLTYDQQELKSYTLETFFSTK